MKKTGRFLVAHEAAQTCGFAAELIATVQEECFAHLEAPLARICGYDTPFPLAYERCYVPDVLRCVEGITRTVNYWDKEWGEMRSEVKELKKVQKVHEMSEMCDDGEGEKSIWNKMRFRWDVAEWVWVN